jgi:hypothetical protein
MARNSGLSSANSSGSMIDRLTPIAQQLRVRVRAVLAARRKKRVRAVVAACPEKRMAVVP